MGILEQVIYGGRGLRQTSEGSRMGPRKTLGKGVGWVVSGLSQSTLECEWLHRVVLLEARGLGFCVPGSVSHWGAALCACVLTCTYVWGNL